MKVSYYKTLLLFIYLVLGHCQNLKAQIDEVVDRFVLVENGGKVYMSITISAGFSCNGIGILRSSDNVNFVQIGMIQGICGSPNSPSFYEFTDEKPLKNTFNYYKLVLGNIGENTPKSILIFDTRGQKFALLENPVNGKLKIVKSKEDGSEEATILFYNAEGRLLQKGKIINEYHEENVTHLHGLHYLIIFQKNEIAFSKSVFFY